ncbi:DNA polymerase III subunit gamma/tau [Lactobacillus sp. PV034]|uniref:DNA polymerase III subunit gamma/tau n=1 Tax=Lactobacillus sp. PV034 TaxID=2594495 RepID=UPI0022403D8D|nr:DNA polymerase III subunit gamma/tau [Lactobacillus sp. PV034]QNQ81429.1 DNA polymerase III subunit gamma/tau [Lactobacillus sp. PV034]
MAYQALYRKWRPKTFDDVVGQGAITDTLKNAITRNKISHAFLFAGPRGTGKTSCAKIFAKALNCTNLQDGEPCNECENCLAADKGSMNDIIEIDAASNNGVDEIRDIRDKVKYAPTQGKYKVYIIDEVHMLSMGAFNALLKTLEEPPEHVVFILATTELQKVPATIISRTQRYNFKRISEQDLVARMQYILKQEQIDFEPKALDVIAQIADGGMRDSLSILDQILSYDQDTVKYDDALKITGYADQTKIESLLLNLLQHQTQSALDLVKELIQNGSSSQNILDEIIQLTVRVMLAVKGKQEEHFLIENYLEQVKGFDQAEFSQIVERANEALNDLRFTNQQQIPLYVFIVKVTQEQDQIVTKNTAANPNQTPSKDDSGIIKLQEQVASLQKQVLALQKSAPSAINNNFSGRITDDYQSKKAPVKQEIAKSSSSPETPKIAKRINKNTKAAQENNRRQVYHVLENATKQDIAAIKDIWPDLLTMLEVSQRAVLEVLEPVAASSSQVVLKCKYELWFERANKDNDLVEQLESKIARLTKHNYDIVLVADGAWAQVRKDFVASHKEELLAKKLKKIEASEQKESEAKDSQPTAQQQQEVVDKAKDLFGDLAQVKD